MRTGLVGTLAILLAGTSLALAQRPELLPPPAAPPKADSKADGAKSDDGKGSGPAVQSTVETKPEWVIPGAPMWAGCNTGCCKEDDKHKNTAGCGWFSAEYLYWWMKDAPLPPGNIAGLGSLDYGPAAGIRFNTGLHNEDGTVGLEGGMFFLEKRSATVDASAGGLTGSGTVANRFWGGEALLSKAAFGQYCKKKCSYQVDLLGGFQYLNLGESFDAFLANSGGVTESADIHTRNQFYGAELGARSEFRAGRFFFLATTTCGLGYVHQRARLDAFEAGVGTLSVSTSHGDFTVVPQATLDVGYQLTRHLRVYGGYDFLFIDRVARPGDNVFLGVPGSGIQRGEFWTHGINVGAAWHF